MLRDLGVKYHISVSDNKCSLVEACQKTLQRKIYSYMVNKETYRYIDVLQEIVEGYNGVRHRSLGMSPNDAKLQKNFKEIQLLNMAKLQKLANVKPPVIFKIGDQVRITIDKKKACFLRSYDPQNSIAKYEVWKISTRASMYAKYFLKHVGRDDKITGGWFHANQLVPATNKTFRGHVIDSRKRRGKKEVKFTFSGYPPRFDEWLTEDAVVSDLG